jgi:hypothetical protein
MWGNGNKTNDMVKATSLKRTAMGSRFFFFLLLLIKSLPPANTHTPGYWTIGHPDLQGGGNTLTHTHTHTHTHTQGYWTNGHPDMQLLKNVHRAKR